MEALQAPLSTGSDQSPYQPIDSEGGEIRLVELAPGRYGDPISLSLRTVKIEEWVTDEDESDDDDSDDYESDDDESNWEESDGWNKYTPSVNLKSEYEALSYAWGIAISPHKALVAGFALPITESLDQGLRRLRFDNKPRMLWIDALCINQRDVEERSHQVQHMATIYRSANKVLLWLGEWPNNAACSHSDNCQALWLSTLRGEEERGIPIDIPLHILQHHVDILELPWFGRLWIIQELALARMDPILLIGSLSISWSRFSEAVIDLDVYGDAKFPDDDQLRDRFGLGRQRVSNLTDIRLRSGSHRGLYWCLIASKRARFANPLDKVYGLLGLCEFQVTEAIAVDYSKSLLHILAEATVVSILEESAFPYLNEDTRPAGCFDRTHWTNSSWMLDFTSIPKDPYLGYVPNAELDMEERKERRGSIRLSTDFRTLYAHGRYVGTVCETQNSSWAWGKWDAGFRDPTPNTEIYDFYHNILKPRSISPRTLLQVLRRRRISDEEIENFASLLLGSSDGFQQNFTLNVYYNRHGISGENLGHLGGRDIFVTEEGHLGVSWHHDCRLVPKGAVLVCLLGTEVPFILAPVPGTQSHELINVAYVPGYGDDIFGFDFDYADSESATWINFAAEGGREYAIV